MVAIAATSEGALKAFIEAQGLGISAYRDQPEAGKSRPYVTVSAVSLVPDLSGDFGSAEEPTVSELLDVHVWQTYRDTTTNAVTEVYTLVPALRRALHGAVLLTGSSAPPTHTHGVEVVDSRRLLEDEENIVHDVITVRVRRYL